MGPGHHKRVFDVSRVLPEGHTPQCDVAARKWDTGMLIDQREFTVKASEPAGSANAARSTPAPEGAAYSRQD